MQFQKSGYNTDGLFSDVALGISDGLDGALWSYVFATIIFSGVLSIFAPIGFWIILLGWVVASVFITLTSKVKIHIVSIDEQAVVIFGSIGILLVAKLGAEAASAAGLATMLAIMSVTSFIIAVVFLISSRSQISRLLELLPFPVICGYMAGIAWLLLDAGVAISIDAPISLDMFGVLAEGDNALKLIMALLGGGTLVVLTNKIDKAWALPAASILIVALFFGVASIYGLSKDDLVASGWIYDIQNQSGGVQDVLFGLSWGDIDVDFMVSVLPQILTVVFLTMLSSSMNLSIMAATNPKTQFDASEEMKGLSVGNFMLGALACPPGYSDAVTSTLYEDFGAKSRWMPLASSAATLVVLFSGTTIISYMPNVLLCSTILLFSFQMFYDWMYENVRSFTLLDYSIVLTILITVITMGFMEGILVGMFLTVFLFVLRYSMISAIGGHYTLSDHRSSVERSPSCNQSLNLHGNEALVLSLRGFLFFGSANAVRDFIREKINKGNFVTILFDLRRVTGVDISALNTLVQIKETCEAADILVLYAGANQEIDAKITTFGVASQLGDEALSFGETDFAMERMEEILLDRHADETVSGSILNQLIDVLGNEQKAKLLFEVMGKSVYQTGDELFHQGDSGGGFFLLESGSMTAMIHLGGDETRRVKKFNPGSVIGEMSNYSAHRKRTATVVANETSVLYYIDPAAFESDGGNNAIGIEKLAAVHELVARTLSLRIDYMNRRLMLELT